MDTKLLKQKILDLAIHGKLVPQNPNDESATVLLEKIRAEKAEKIKKGELKADKNDSYIFVGEDNRHYEKFADGTVKDIEDEIPFDVPEGWAWCRFSDCTINRDSERKPVSSKDRKDIKKIYDYYGATGIVDKVESYLFDEKLLLIGEDGANLLSRSKNNAFIATGKYWVNNHAHVIDATDKDFLEYLKTYINSLILDEFITGSAQPKFTQAALNTLYVPFPPKNEQKRIIIEIERIFSIIDTLETDKLALQTAIKQAKSKILDLAIHGKLVPQDPNDESASVLLERLREEKEAKIAKGELKRDKNDSYIYKSTTDNCHYEKFNGKEAVCIDEEIPFDIPENWQWVKLGRICTKLVDGDHNPPKGIEEKTDYIMASSRNINHNTVEDLENVRYLTKEMFEIENQRTKATEGDIFFTSVGTLGRSCIYDGSLNICFQRSVSILKTEIDNKYLKYFFDSSFYQNYVVEHATGTAQMGFYLQEMSESYIAIPPISEQKRIVSKIEEMFERLDQIQGNLI
ncbi:MAG: restriction endonuclease subunit S [Treponema sp.]|nr:restriction endonuclease subunit S [Treponema sp.]